MSESRAIIHVPRRFVAHEWGGTETVILEISKKQAAAGCAPLIMTSMALADRYRDEVEGIPIERHRHIYPFLGLSKADKLALDKKGGNLLSPGLLFGLLRAPNVKLFHAHSLKRLGATVRTAAKLRKLPYVVSLHGGVFDVPADELASLQDPVKGKFEWGKPFGALLGSRRVLEDADHVICVGEPEARKAREQLGHDRVSYLPNGVDSQKFLAGDGRAFRDKHQIAHDCFVIANISRIDPQKNQLCLVKAFARFAATHPDSLLLLIGPETHTLYATQLREAIAKSGMSSRVKLLPGIANDSPDLVNAFHAADLFVLPSRHEPFGIAALEAWCAGKPVIASQVGGLGKLVEHDRTGLLFDPAANDADNRLAAHLTTLYQDRKHGQSLACAGRDHALETYDWQQVVAQLDAIYQQAIDHHKQANS